MTVRTIDEIFRDFVTDGVPASGPFNPHKPDIRDTLKALTEGSDNFPDNRVIRLNNANEGTANNIVVTASVAIPAAAYQVLYILNVTQENTGPVKVSGAINRDLVTNINQPVPAGYLMPGMALLCIDTGTELRLLSYGDAEAILAAAEAAADRAEDAAVAAEAAAGGLLSNFDTVASIEATSIPSLVNYVRTSGYYTVGDGGGALYKRVSGEPSHAGKVQSADGAWWELVTDVANVRMFGAKGDGVSDDYSSIMGAYGYLSAKGISILKFPATGSSYYSVSSLVFDAPVPLVLEGDGRLSSQLSFASSVVDGVIIGPATGYNHRPQLVRDVGFSAASSTDRVHLNARNCVVDIDNVSTYDGRHGLILDQCFSYSVRNCQFNGSRLEALFCQNSADAHNSEIRSNGFFGCGVATNSYAVRLEKSDSILIMQNQFEECWGGIELRGCYSVTMLANYIERGAGGPPFYLNKASDIEARKCGSIVVEGCWFALNAPTYIENVDGLTLNNNTIYYQTIGFGPASSSSGIIIGQNTVIDGGVIDNPPWTSITTINGWSTGDIPLACNATSDGIVSIRGFITRSSGSGNQSCGTLPPQFRPRTEKRVAVPASDGFKLCVINTAGSIYVEAGDSFSGTVYIDLTYLR